MPIVAKLGEPAYLLIGVQVCRVLGSRWHRGLCPFAFQASRLCRWQITGTAVLRFMGARIDSFRKPLRPLPLKLRMLTYTSQSRGRPEPMMPNYQIQRALELANTYYAPAVRAANQGLSVYRSIEPQLQELQRLARQVREAEDYPRWLLIRTFTFARGGWHDAPLLAMPAGQFRSIINDLVNKPDEEIKRESSMLVSQRTFGTTTTLLSGTWSTNGTFSRTGAGRCSRTPSKLTRAASTPSRYRPWPRR
jgi:hypothetical protein